MVYLIYSIIMTWYTFNEMKSKLSRSTSTVDYTTTITSDENMLEVTKKYKNDSAFTKALVKVLDNVVENNCMSSKNKIVCTNKNVTNTIFNISYDSERKSITKTIVNTSSK